LEVQVLDQVHAFFAVAMISEVWNGAGTLFWTDWWLHEQQLADLAPSLLLPSREEKDSSTR
jgi:hypothetical protein